MPKIIILIFLSFLLAVNAAAQDAAIDDVAGPGIARFPYTKAAEKDPVIPAGGAANLISASTYAFSAQSGIALEDMSSGTTQLIGPGSDNDNSPVADIGFLYRYDGGFFTSFGVNTNGLLRLGGATSTNLSLNALNSVSNSPKIAPYWDDLCTGNTGKVHYKLVPGPVGTQKLVIEWKDMKITRGPACDGSGAGTFQLWLYDRTGVIQFVYGSGMTTASAANGGYSAGLQSGAAANFASVSTSTNSVSYTAADNAQSGAITAGSSYLFSPNIPAAATGLNASPVSQGSATINWTDNAFDETGYLVRRTTDMVNFYFVGILPPNSSTFTDTGLEQGTQYFYFVNAFTEGAFGPDASLMVTTNGTPGTLSSKPGGGSWQSASTWVGGRVPDVFDNVNIVAGSFVTISSADAVAGSVTISPTGAIRFATTGGAYKLTVTTDVVIDAGGAFTVFNGGSGNQNILSLGGSLINNGTLDFCNANLAAAGIVFTGASSSTFGGTGPVTDIFTLTINKGSSANILDLTPANFTVQGSATDGPGSGFLFLNSGTLKISGTFSGTHRTFASPDYQVVAAAGLWLNNPNYTIAGQNGQAGILGLLRVSAGNYNIGTTQMDGLNLIHLSTVLIEGGSVTVSGSMGIRQISTPNARLNYTQTGGTVSTCTIGRFGNSTDICFDMGELPQSSVTLAGGDILIQNSQNETLFNLDYRNMTGSGMTTTTNTTVHFGNALTTGSGLFAAGGRLPNVVLSANHSLKFPNGGEKPVRNFTIEQGAVLHGGVTTYGDRFINNGLINSTTFSSFGINSPGQDVVYSGAGTVSGVFATFSLNARSLTIAPEAGNIRVWVLTVTSAVIVNAERFIIGNGNNDTIQSRIEFKDNAGSMDTAPNFDIGTGGLKISYEGGPRATGPEIPSNRVVPGELLFIGPGPYTISGGDLTVNTLNLFNGIVSTGGSTVTALTGAFGGAGNSYLDGKLRRRINSSSGNVFFPVGHNGASLVTLDVRARVVPSYITVSTVDQPLPGLLPSTAVQRYWKFVEEGDVTAYVQFQYPPTGDVSNYRIWRSTGGTPQEIPFGPRDAASIGTGQTITEFTGDWGVGAQLDPGPVSISGKVTASGGMPIRNATVTISGGNLPLPVTVLTGSLGSYIFSGLQAGVSYHISASAKRYRFTPGGQNVNPSGNVENVDFAANP